MTIVCEVRVPTFQRPALLRRALLSLLAQTETNWRAIVLDDGPGREGREIVAEIGDRRIEYRPNACRLGAAGNLDQAFRTRTYGRSEFACVLEDDNALLPEFIADTALVARREGAGIVLRNQLIARDDGSEYSPTGETTRGALFDDGWISILRLRAALFFSEGISNGGLFWSTAARSELAVGSTVGSASLQEMARTLQVREPIWFAAVPLAIFSLPPDGGSSREPLENRIFNRARQSLLTALRGRHGHPLVEEARLMAGKAGMDAALAQGLGDLLTIEGVPTRNGLLLLAKGIAKRLLVDDPMRAYVQKWLPVDKD